MMGADREKIKEHLLERKREIELQLQRIAEDRTSVELEEVQDPLDQALKSSMDDLNITLEENEREEYERILKALAMIDAGTYGVCVDCQQPISERRLMLYPNATRCIVCQESQEAL